MTYTREGQEGGGGETRRRARRDDREGEITVRPFPISPCLLFCHASRKRRCRSIVVPYRSGSQCKLVLFCLEVYFTFYFYFLQLYCPNWISPMGNSVCLPRGNPAATESHYPILRRMQGFHNPPNSDLDYGIFTVRTDVNACDCTRGCTDTVRESALKTDREKNPLLHWGIKTASAVRCSTN